MSETASPRALDRFDGVAPEAAQTSVVQNGSALFPDLVWAHYRYERERHRGRKSDAELEALESSYLVKLDEFQDSVGKLEQVYWSTKGASAVAMSVKEGARRTGWFSRLPGLLEQDDIVQLHRLSDWVTGEAAQVADLLHECDLLAIRVGEVLRGTSERIAMRWLLGVQAHLLGFIERTERLPDEATEKALVKAQRQHLIAIENYYHRAASKTGRLIYVTGMLMGIPPVFLLGTLLGLLLWATGHWDREPELLLLSVGAGGVGALVSAISRMGKPEKGTFNIDFELGRPLIRRLGFYRPFLGAIAGAALFFFLASGIAEVSVDRDQEFFYYGFAAFLAGFSERFVNVMFGAAEKRLSNGQSEDNDSGERLAQPP